MQNEQKRIEWQKGKKEEGHWKNSHYKGKQWINMPSGKSYRAKSREIFEQFKLLMIQNKRSPKVE